MMVLIRPFPLMSKGEIVGNMMLNVVLDGNPLDEDDGNLLLKMFLMLGEFINDVNLMFYK